MSSTFVYPICNLGSEFQLHKITLLLVLVIPLQLLELPNWKTYGPWGAGAARLMRVSVWSLWKENTKPHLLVPIRPLLSSYDKSEERLQRMKSRETNTLRKKAVPLAEQTVSSGPAVSSRDAVRHSIYGLKAPHIFVFRVITLSRLTLFTLNLN